MIQCNHLFENKVMSVFAFSAASLQAAYGWQEVAEIVIVPYVYALLVKQGTIMFAYHLYNVVLLTFSNVIHVLI
jgi:hypothetical protein